ncbi:TonB-dependent receptor domain-containing protein [Stenotrophomonas sp. LARHCG68]|jgi:outer membrane receptor protein involved in Fe transport
MYRIARKSTPTRKLLSCALASCLLLGAAPAFAQSTAATIRGQVMADSSPAAQAQVTATNIATGLSRSVQSTASGSYSLAGLPPGTYRVEVNAGGKTSTQNITVQVGQTATVNLGVGGVGETTAGGAATTLDAVQVVAQAPIETKTSEIATYITPRQIEALPQGTRNFLAFADTVPGMAFEQNPANGSTKLRGGVQNANNVNVYIDGIGQKNYVTQGGITGQDASRGNPFPQLAIGEYKVITSNYKAEYDQISSAAVTAVTKSGTNEFKGSFFWDYTNQDWREPRESEKDAGKTRSGEKQYGAAFGGPIVKDKAHFFVTYEAKEYNAPQDLSPGEGRIAGDLPQAWRDQLGATSTPFKEDLYFGKLDWSINEENLVELTYKRREESEIGNVGGQSARSYGTDTGVNEDRYDLRWQFSNANWLNDAHLTYEKAFWTKAPVNMANGMVLTDGSGDDGKQIYRIGGGEGGLQDKGQKGWSFQNDTTFFGWEGHTVKFGVKYKQVDLDTIEQQPYNPQFYYDIHQGGAVPYFVRFGSAAMGTDGGSVTSKNKQFGLYIQDDWDVTERLTLNLGLRWDYEKTPSYLDYVTSGDVLASLASADPNAPGQTYAQSLALGGIDVNRYISTGNNRKPFKDAIQPRLGFSYDLTGDERHVIFGGIGRSYDRNLFDYLQLERSKATFPTRRFKINSPGHACDLSASDCLDWSPQLLDRDYLMSLVNSTDAGREVWMFDNDLKTPYSDQISLGIRDSFNLGGLDWNSSATVQHTRYKDGLLIMRGNRYPDGGVFAPNGSPWSAPGLPGMGSLIVATNGFESKSTALLLSLDKPYTSESPWNVNVAYTLTDAKQNIHEKDPVYGWYFTQGGWYDGAWTPRHRLVISGFTDLPWGMSVSGKLTLASKIKRWDIDSTAAYGGYERPHSWEPDGTLGFKQFDLSLTKTWDTGTDLKLKMRADLLNAFNWTNWGGYGINWDTGVINSWDQYQTRTFKLSFGLDW